MDKQVRDRQPDGDLKPTILFIARDAEERYHLRELLVQQEYEVYSRTNRMRAFQLMTVYQIDLVIVDLELEDGHGLNFIQDFRGDSSFSTIPIVMIGEDNERGEVCIAALQAGADDFVEAPFIPEVCLARVNRLLARRLKSRNQVKSSLSVEVASGELPGILQYLEAEVKTGKLTVKGPNGSAVIHIRDGRFVHATAPLCEGPEAMTEALSWEKSQVTFEEVELQEHEIKGEQQLTSVLMNAVVDVDEFREAKQSLPPSDAMFVKGEKKLPKTMARNQRMLWEQALNGYSSDELLNDQPYGERQATLWLRELIQEDYLKVTHPPFHDYTPSTFDYYKRLYYQPRLLNIRKILADIKFPIKERNRQLPIQPANWISPAAKLILTGDRPDHVQMFMDAVRTLYEHHTDKTPPTHQMLPGAEKMRLDFGDKNVLDIQRLPPVLENRFLKSLDEYLEDSVAVFMIATEQTRKANQMNLRLIRQIRQRAKSVFYNIVPKVTDREGRTLFKLDCHNCGYRLAVDMEEAGNQGECPICNADVMIPDALDHLAHSLQLPSDIPIVMVEPYNCLHVRDLLMLMIDSIAYASNPPPDAAEPQHETRQKPPTATGTPEVRERGNKAPREKIQLAPREPEEPAPQPPARKLAEPPHQPPSRKPEPTLPILEQSDDTPDEITRILDLSRNVDPFDDGEDEPPLDLDDLLESPDDDFDIDAFIKRVQKD